MTDSMHLVQKLWNYCNILRDAGLSYGDDVEQFEPFVAGAFLEGAWREALYPVIS